MTVEEDAITTEEVLVALVAEEVQLQEEKGTLPQDVKVPVVDLEATEVQHHVKVVLVEEANLEVHHLLELAVSLREALDQPILQDVMVVLQKDQQDVLKVLATRQEKEDLEEVNTFC